MVLYFTGTGNSRYIARKIAKATGDGLIDLNERIKNGDTGFIDNQRLVFVVPTYAWRIPRIVDRWIRDTAFKASAKAWFIMDCGGSIGSAAKYNKRLCRRKGFVYMGTYGITMPENYVAMFSVPDDAEAKAIIAAAEPHISSAIDTIASDQMLPEKRNTLNDAIESDIVNPIFYAFYVKADDFCANEGCIGCGLCARLCPLNNIAVKDGKPTWGRECTHCMACICHCPTEAIEYGTNSQGKPRYHID